MAATALPQGKFEFLVVIPDKEGALSTRREVRSKHFEGLKTLIDGGFLKMGGAMLEEVPKDGEPMNFLGSSVIAVASTKEEVLETLGKDIYATSGVWDLSKAQIYPFLSGYRAP